MPTKLTLADLSAAAASLGCELAAIRAVDEVESNGNGFTAAGQLVLRFETHKFLAYTKISVAGSDRAAYERAARINHTAAMLSTSWGRYQIMGFNWATLGYGSVTEMVADFETGEAAHLRGFVAFVKANGIAGALARREWAAFAYRYNGAGFAVNKYDQKLATAYAKYATHQPVDPVADPKKKTAATALPSPPGWPSSGLRCGTICKKADTEPPCRPGCTDDVTA